MSCGEKNNLIREGTSHLDRVLAALSTGYAKVDEREPADIILFATRYAAYLNYYDASDTVAGNWEPLMKMDISVTLATLMKTDTRAVSDYKKILYKNIKLAANDAEAEKEFKFLFDLIFSLISLLDRQYRLVPDDFELKLLIRNVIENKMRQALVNTSKVFDDCKANGLVDIALTGLDGEAPVPVSSCSAFNINDLGDEWEGLTHDVNITMPGFPSAQENIVHVINHNLFNAQIEILFKGVSEIELAAAKLFEQTLDDFPTHAPHYALFLSFIQLFRHAQDHLNTYTQRHLDFYYKDTLQLVNKDPEPDSVHLVFELQKPVVQHLLTKDTLFKGGKDVTGKEINYALQADIVLNKAKVAAIHSRQFLQPGGILLGAQVANSEDGQGAAMKSADQSWFSFGNPKNSADIKSGFAIASNILYLNEGSRTVTIIVNFETKKQGPAGKPTINYNCFRALVTGKKDWYEVHGLKVSGDVLGRFLRFSFTLQADEPPVIPYSTGIHKDNFSVELPMVKIFLIQGASNPLPYPLLCKKKINTVDISVQVSNVKDLVLSNDAGSIDASKPFKPFGDFPDNGASFYIGNKEIFQKNLRSLHFNLPWKINSPAPSADFALKPKAGYLRQAAWKDSFTLSNNQISFQPRQFTATTIDFDKNETLKANSLAGFLRIQLHSSHFSQAHYMGMIKTALNNMTMTDNNGTFSISTDQTPIPNEIILETFSVDYSAASTISFSLDASANNDLYFYLSPFGYTEVNSRFIDHSTNAEPARKITLLEDIIHEGELLIGFEQAVPTMVLNVLFQVADGSSNPLKDMETLSWFYLAHNNNWKEFEKRFVIDGTRNFTQAGIVTLTLPDDISNNITALENGLHWIKACVAHNCDAVCKMIQVQAQAARVTLLQDETKQIEFRQLLPAGSISKSVISDASVKTISQPFDSFDGRTRESDEHFYTRVSERLRHKQRAITIWDYEHIILEQFPPVFKVKCLNHSGFYTKGNGEVFCENYPGHVTIVTIPDLVNKTNSNPLRPYTPIGLLEDIHDYLQTLVSPFVKLHVKNPQFEEIQLDFNVTFYANLDESFYTQLLISEIEKFLCPWAYNDRVEISFGGKISKSAVLNFVEERSYVDFVTCFKMNQFITDPVSGQVEIKKDIETAEGSTSRSILVSYYNADTGVKHIIKTPAICEC